MTASYSAPHSSLETLLASLPERYPGPGGAVAVVQNGKTLIRHTWGYASLERRLPFTPASLFRMCSITKQFTCAVMLARHANPEVLAPFIERRLPLLKTRPTVHQLAHNQSGLRDYWAMAMLQGAAIEGMFNDADAWRLIGRTRSLQFAPGTSYSYVNQNFRLLSDALEQESGRSFGELLQEHVFKPAGMERAILAADTAAMPDGTEGYEAMGLGGARPAVNNIYWTGDAGLGASLDDMIAWEKYIDTTRNDPTSLYNRLSAPVAFNDGTSSSYGFGLAHGSLAGHAMTSHGGALRGWRSHRLHIAEKRLSVVVMFNHVSPAHMAATELAEAALAQKTAPVSIPTPVPASSSRLIGTWLEENTGLSARIEATGQPNKLRLRYLMVPEDLTIESPEKASASGLTLGLGNDGMLLMHRPSENRTGRFRRRPEAPLTTNEQEALCGRYLCHEQDGSEFEVALAGGVLHGGFTGMFGTGRMERLHRLAPNLWTFPCPRALDHTAPGDWTLHFEEQNGEKQVRLGCWLAQNLVYGRAT